MSRKKETKLLAYGMFGYGDYITLCLVLRKEKTSNNLVNYTVEYCVLNMQLQCRMS